MSKKVIATMNGDGHMMVIDLTDDDKARNTLEDIFKQLDAWDDEEIQESVRDLDWDDINFLLVEWGFPGAHGRDLVVDMKDKIDISTLE